MQRHIDYRTIIASLAFTVGSSTSLAAELDVRQDGSGGRVAVQASSEFTAFDVGIEQGGTDNRLELSIDSGLHALVEQRGDDGLIDLSVSGISAQLDVLQVGQSNQLFGQIGGQDTTLHAEQTGNGNLVTVTTSGQGAHVSLAQSGDDNRMSADSNGAPLDLRQLGDGNHLDVGDLSGSTGISVVQEGRGESLVITR